MPDFINKAVTVDVKQSTGTKMLHSNDHPLKEAKYILLL